MTIEIPFTLPIACPECGDTEWYAFENYMATDRVDFFTAVNRTDTENIKYNGDLEGWWCSKNDHPAPDDLSDQLNEAHTYAG